MESTIIAKC